jgi:uncharacterized UBP type Zn finger protein
MAKCQHLDQIQEVKPNTQGLETGGRWVNLRLCLVCGHVGCCDSSPGKHATRHFHDTGHPIVQLGIEGGEECWCYVDSVSFPRP